MMRALLTVFLALAPAAAQTPPLPAVTDGAPAALQSLRARCAESLIVADRAVTAQWVASMTDLEKSRAAAGDYEGAHRARTRREQALAAAGTDDGRMPILLSTKNLTGKGTGLVVGETRGTATFKSNGAYIEWDITGDFNGWYEVLLSHAVVGGRDWSGEVSPVTGPIPASFRERRNDPDYYAPAAGGWVSFQNVSSLSRSNTVLRRELVSTGGWNAWRAVSLGRIQFNPTRIAKFRLAGEEIARDGLMHFKQLDLVPVAEPAAAATTGEARLTAMRETFRKTFRTRIAGSVTTYKAALTALEQQAVRSKDNDLLFRVRDEIKRLTLAPELLALSSDEALAASPSAIALTVGNSFGTSFRGDIALDASKAFLTKLKPAGAASITWRLSAFNVGSGTYEVALKGVVPVTGGGSATLAAFGESSAPAGEPLKFEIKPVVTPEQRSKKPNPFDDYAPPVPDKRTEEPGKITIAKGAQTLTLTVTGLAHTDGWLMDLASLTLTRAREAVVKKNP